MGLSPFALLCASLGACLSAEWIVSIRSLSQALVQVERVLEWTAASVPRAAGAAPSPPPPPAPTPCVCSWEPLNDDAVKLSLARLPSAAALVAPVCAGLALGLALGFGLGLVAALRRARGPVARQWVGPVRAVGDTEAVTTAAENSADFSRFVAERAPKRGLSRLAVSAADL